MGKCENCKQAKSQGNFIDELRKKFPFKIIAHGGYTAYLCDLQPLIGGYAPIYRFPGGTAVVFESELTNIIEW